MENNDRALEILRRELGYHQSRKDESQESINSIKRAIRILEEYQEDNDENTSFNK